MRRATLPVPAFAFAEANASDSIAGFFSIKQLRRDTATSERVFRFVSCCPLPRCCSNSLDLWMKLPVAPIVDRAGSFDDGKATEHEEEKDEEEEEGEGAAEEDDKEEEEEGRVD